MKGVQMQLDMPKKQPAVVACARKDCSFSSRLTPASSLTKASTKRIMESLAHSIKEWQYGYSAEAKNQVETLYRAIKDLSIPISDHHKRKINNTQIIF